MILKKFTISSILLFIYSLNFSQNSNDSFIAQYANIVIEKFFEDKQNNDLKLVEKEFQLYNEIYIYTEIDTNLLKKEFNKVKINYISSNDKFSVLFSATNLKKLNRTIWRLDYEIVEDSLKFYILKLGQIKKLKNEESCFEFIGCEKITPFYTFVFNCEKINNFIKNAISISSKIVYISDTCRFPDFEQNKFIDWLKNNLTYSDKAFNEKIEGVLVLEVFVNDFGRIEDLVVQQSLKTELDKKTLESIKKYSYFSKIDCRGLESNIHYSFVLEIDFKIKD